VRFALAAGVTAIAYPIDETVVVELFGDEGEPKADHKPIVPSAADRAAAMSAPTAAPPAGAPQIRMRVGEHPGFSRVVFDWPSPVGYRVDRQAGAAVVAFDRPARIDPPAISRRPLKCIHDAEAIAPPEGLAIRLSIPESAVVRDFRAGNKVVIDIAEPCAPPAAGRRKPDQPESAPPPAPKAAAAPVAAPVPSPDPAPAPATAPAPVPTSVAVPSKPQPRADNEPAPKAPSGAAPLRFEWDRPVAASTFRRAGRTWVVFDAPPPSAGEVTATADPAGGRVDRLDHATATVLRVTPPEGRQMRLTRDGESWLLEFAPRTEPPAPAIPATAEPQATVDGRMMLRVPVAGAGTPIAVHDPDVGDSLLVVPVGGDGPGFAEDRSYPQLRLLATAQGIAVEPRVDELRVHVDANGVSIFAPEGLALSPVERPRDDGRRSDPPDDHASLLFEASTMESAGRGQFARRLQALVAKTASTAGAARERARLDLCRFYLAHGLAAECFGILRLIGEQRPAADNETHVRLLRGVSSFLLGRFAEAKADLAVPSISATAEGRLWQALADAAVGPIIHAERLTALAPTLALAATYPAAVRYAAVPPLVEAAIADGRLDDAARLIAALADAPATVHDRPWIAYLRGTLAAKQGDAETALRLWGEAEKGAAREVRARAAFARATFRLARGEITPREAVDTFARLQSLWRGDRFEFDLLRRLGPLQIEAGDYADGLRTLESAARLFRHMPESRAVVAETTDAFERLFLSDGDERLTPIEAIALHHDFQRLVRHRDKDGRIARRFAERLIEADLLEQAARVLEEQLARAPDGATRSRAGLELARVHLADARPEAALDALARTEAREVPSDLARERRRQRAQALAALARPDDALAAIEGDHDADSERVRADVFRARRDWTAMASSLQRVTEGAADPAGASGTPAPPTATLVDLAAAVTLAGDDEARASLRETYATAPMADAEAATFRLLAGAPRAPAATVDDLRAYVDEALAVRTLYTEPR
jgi:hypothetical protein